MICNKDDPGFVSRNRPWDFFAVFCFVAGHHHLTDVLAFLEGFSLEKLTAGT